jgi:hypothetical protein
MTNDKKIIFDNFHQTMINVKKNGFDPMQFLTLYMRFVSGAPFKPHNYDTPVLYYEAVNALITDKTSNVEAFRLSTYFYFWNYVLNYNEKEKLSYEASMQSLYKKYLEQKAFFDENDINFYIPTLERV